ncbi:MAG: hypothetical protein QT08_C0013G0013 [archaeon GW2011_AR17]|nr:MAG: hypothetical protein QT08_C0013G0013 [archaeon GW2011_AR17]MBS3153856.1 hypothetical protein [Candidatus Woesearchaeota archaeon]HIH15457.1 hypothetical protein [Nanoarchaeota archaeon]HIH59260.1 hypothetical protein [Nanoarchaeota archaeon]HII13945.1 hypothetical protein [Nanoarchaeota archaeon]
MSLYHFELERTQFYAREKEDIFGVIDFYKEREKKAKKDEGLDSFSKRISPELLETITSVEQGYFRFHVGPLIMPEEGSEEGKEDVFQKLAILPDFSVGVSYEASAYFDIFRRSLPALRRANLYKVQVDNSIFGGLTYIPRDVVDAIVAYDLSDLLQKGKTFREKIASIRHPNIML